MVKDVNDNAPQIVSPARTTVVENVPVNTVILAVKASDKDEGRNGHVEYFLEMSSGSERAPFTLGAADGLLRVAGLVDREEHSNYTLTVVARDRGDPPRVTKSALFVEVLDENDNSPVFDPKQYSASVAENASIGASVLQVSNIPAPNST